MDNDSPLEKGTPEAALLGLGGNAEESEAGAAANVNDIDEDEDILDEDEESGVEEDGSEEMDEAELVTRRTRNRTYDSGKGTQVVVVHHPPPKPKKKKGGFIKKKVVLSRAQVRKKLPPVPYVLPNVDIAFDLAMDPMFVYSVSRVADQGTDVTDWTSYKLKSQVMYLESNVERFELSREPQCSADGYDQYRWARVLDPKALDLEAMKAVRVPLVPSKVTVIEQRLDWMDIHWGPDFVAVRGLAYPVRRVRMMYNHPGPVDAEPQAGAGAGAPAAPPAALPIPATHPAAVKRSAKRRPEAGPSAKPTGARKRRGKLVEDNVAVGVAVGGR